MKVTVKALRDFPTANDDGTNRRIIKEGEELETTLTHARALKEAGKATFDEPRQTRQVERNTEEEK